jgi:uncharacterized RDD family membrane protein YckC
MPGSVVVCKSCGHRLTQASVEKWRTERAQSEGGAPVAKESELAAKMRARFAEKRNAKAEANLIQFPVSPNAPIHAAQRNGQSATAQEPAWRERIKSSVETHRTRQTPNALGTEIASLSDSSPVATVQTNAETDSAAQLLLVESALKRIRRTSAPQPATVAFRNAQTSNAYPAIQSKASQSQALALMEEAERYAEAQRQADETPVVEQPIITRRSNPFAPAKELARAKTTETAEPVRAPRPRKYTAANLAIQVEEEEPLNETVALNEHSLDALPLIAEDLPSLSPDAESLSAASAAEKLRAKAAYFAETQATVEEPEEEPTPWLTDAEVAEVAEHQSPEIWLGKPAPLWMRTLAGVCDIEAAAVLYLPFFAAYYTMDGAFNSSDYYVMGLMVIVVMFLYQLITFTLNGRTFGMAIFGLRNFDVEKASNHISFKRRIQQAFGGTVALLIPPFNLIVTRLTGFERGFGDALAKTVTLRRAQE